MNIILTIKESTRQYPANFICDCRNKVTLALHHDFLENTCYVCGKSYSIKVGKDIWNCCCASMNPPIIEEV